MSDEAVKALAVAAVMITALVCGTITFLAIMKPPDPPGPGKWDGE